MSQECDEEGLVFSMERKTTEQLNILRIDTFRPMRAPVDVVTPAGIAVDKAKGKRLLSIAIVEMKEAAIRSENLACDGEATRYQLAIARMDAMAARLKYLELLLCDTMTDLESRGLIEPEGFKSFLLERP